MSLFSPKESNATLLINEEDESLLSRQEMGERNLVALRAALSKVIRKMKLSQTKEQPVNLLFEHKGEIECVIELTFKVTSESASAKYYHIRTEISGKNKKKFIAYRDYVITITSSKIDIKSGMSVDFGYEGHKLGTALLQASDEIVECFLKIAKKDDVEGKIVEMEITDDAAAHDNRQFVRKKWTSIVALGRGFSSNGGSGNKLYKRYR